MLWISGAGSGCLIGGVVIGCYRELPEAASHVDAEFVSGMIAPGYFQNDDPEEPDRYTRRRYLAVAAQVVAVCLGRLKATLAEEVAICSGHVLEGVRAWLTTQGYHWQVARSSAIREPVGAAFHRHLAELGFNISHDLLADYARAGLFWWRQIQWLKGGDVNAPAPDPARAAVCKTGWAAYPLWAYHPYNQARLLVPQARYRRAKRRHQEAGKRTPGGR